jgi:hypothetical protein
MHENPRKMCVSEGVSRPRAGWASPKSALLAALFAFGCGEQAKEHTLPPLQVGMTKDVAPIYDDGELRIYEVKRGIEFPILAPTDETMRELGQIDMEPYGRRPWITTDDVGVQLTWTLSNLDDETHEVEVLVDPWNEFGRYYPGLQLTDAEDQEFLPNFSAIDKLYVLPGKSEGDASRLHGTYTFSDLEEVAIDFATVMNILANPPSMEGMSEEQDLRVVYANHAFHWQNRSYKDLLIQDWVPEVPAGLTGLDIGLRTSEPATIAIEVAIEVVDRGNERVREKDDDSPLLPPTQEIITVGTAPP